MGTAAATSQAVVRVGSDKAWPVSFVLCQHPVGVQKKRLLCWCYQPDTSKARDLTHLASVTDGQLEVSRVPMEVRVVGSPDTGHP